MQHPPVLVIHGYMAPKFTNLPVHVALRRRGRSTFDVPIPGLNTQDLARSSALVGDTARRVMRDTGADTVDLVGVSMGGVIAVHYVRVLGGHATVRRTIALGSPLRGTHVAKLVSGIPGVGTRASRQMSPDSDIVRAIADNDPDADIISVYADGDSVVPEAATRLPGIRSVRAPVGSFPFGHYQLVVDPRNLEFVARQLE